MGAAATKLLIECCGALLNSRATAPGPRSFQSTRPSLLNASRGSSPTVREGSVSSCVAALSEIIV